MKFLPVVICSYVLMMAGAASAAAQTLPSKDVDTVKSGIGEESLAPIVVKQPVVATSVSSVPSTSLVGAEGTVPALDPFTVKGVVATLSNTTGFDRDAALEVAAREALPTVLVNMGHTSEKATKLVKALGSAMRFVKGYKVVKESLLPTYTLTTDISFNSAMLLKNFGGKIPVVEVGKSPMAEVPVVSGVSDTSVEVSASSAPQVVARQWVVRVSDRDPAAVDLVRVHLAAQPSTKAVYRLVTSVGAEFVVETPMTVDDIARAAGHSVDVVALESPLPTSVIPTDDNKAWQGREPATLDTIPSVPGTPNASEGTY